MRHNLMTTTLQANDGFCELPISLTHVNPMNPPSTPLCPLPLTSLDPPMTPPPDPAMLSLPQGWIFLVRNTLLIAGTS